MDFNFNKIVDRSQDSNPSLRLGEKSITGN